MQRSSKQHFWRVKTGEKANGTLIYHHFTRTMRQTWWECHSPSSNDCYAFVKASYWTDKTVAITGARSRNCVCRPVLFHFWIWFLDVSCSIDSWTWVTSKPGVLSAGRHLTRRVYCDAVHLEHDFGVRRLLPFAKFCQQQLLVFCSTTDSRTPDKRTSWDKFKMKPCRLNQFSVCFPGKIRAERRLKSTRPWGQRLGEERDCP